MKSYILRLLFPFTRFSVSVLAKGVGLSERGYGGLGQDADRPGRVLLRGPQDLQDRGVLQGLPSVQQQL